MCKHMLTTLINIPYNNSRPYCMITEGNYKMYKNIYFYFHSYRWFKVPDLKVFQ